MGELKDRLKDDLTTSMKARDELRTATLRMVLTAIGTEEVAGKAARTLSADEELKVVTREAKKRREAAEAFRSGGAEDRAARELAEEEVLAAYLPAQLSDDELPALVAEAVAVDRRQRPERHGRRHEGGRAEGRRPGRGRPGRRRRAGGARRLTPRPAGVAQRSAAAALVQRHACRRSRPAGRRAGDGVGRAAAAAVARCRTTRPPSRDRQPGLDEHAARPRSSDSPATSGTRTSSRVLEPLRAARSRRSSTPSSAGRIVSRKIARRDAAAVDLAVELPVDPDVLHAP